MSAISSAYQELIRLDAELARIGRVESVLGIDECRHASRLLDARDGVKGERRLAARFRAVHLDDASARIAPDAQRQIEANAPGGNDWHVGRESLPLFKPHNRAFAIFLLDRGDGEVDGLAAILVFHEA
jgi:hypothetical protein